MTVENAEHNGYGQNPAADIEDFNQLRAVRWQPLTDNVTFELRTWDTGRRDSMGKNCVGYQFEKIDKLGKRTTIFSGEDFFCAPGDCIDSDSAVCSLMSFLTLKPGDTDDDYFKDYTVGQHDFATSYACETLSCDVSTYEELLHGNGPCPMCEDWAGVDKEEDEDDNTVLVCSQCKSTFKLENVEW